MGYNFCQIAIAFSTITSILATFKDFVIENERDVPRFGALSENMYDDLAYDDDASNAIAGKCDRTGALSHPYVAEENCWPGSIDDRVLNAIVQHLANLADFHKSQNLFDDCQGPYTHQDFESMSDADDVDSLENDGGDCLFL